MVDETVSVGILKQHISNFPSLVVMLGSGWDKVLESVDVETEISYTELFGVSTTVKGHTGKLVIGTIGHQRAAFMAGRFHTYEGFTARQVTLPIRVFREAGCTALLITSASGGLNEAYNVGDFVVLTDVITTLLSPDNPLVGPEFVDMSCVFDEHMRRLATSICQEQGIPFKEGIYAYTHGPHYETPADKRAIRLLGADVVGMSTVPEAIMARALGIRVLGLSFVTNLAFVKHSHEEVVAAAQRGSAQMAALLAGIIDTSVQRGTDIRV